MGKLPGGRRDKWLPGGVRLLGECNNLNPRQVPVVTRPQPGQPSLCEFAASHCLPARAMVGPNFMVASRGWVGGAPQGLKAWNASEGMLKWPIS